MTSEGSERSGCERCGRGQPPQCDGSGTTRNCDAGNCGAECVSRDERLGVAGIPLAANGVKPICCRGQCADCFSDATNEIWAGKMALVSAVWHHATHFLALRQSGAIALAGVVPRLPATNHCSVDGIPCGQACGDGEAWYFGGDIGGYPPKTKADRPRHSRQQAFAARNYRPTSSGLLPARPRPRLPVRIAPGTGAGPGNGCGGAKQRIRQRHLAAPDFVRGVAEAVAAQLASGSRLVFTTIRRERYPSNAQPFVSRNTSRRQFRVRNSSLFQNTSHCGWLASASKTVRQPDRLDRLAVINRSTLTPVCSRNPEIVPQKPSLRGIATTWVFVLSVRSKAVRKKLRCQ